MGDSRGAGWRARGQRAGRADDAAAPHRSQTLSWASGPSSVAGPRSMEQSLDHMVNPGYLQFIIPRAGVPSSVGEAGPEA